MNGSPPEPDPQRITVEALLHRLTSIEHRLDALEKRPTGTGGSRSSVRHEVPGGVRAFRRPAIWLGILLLLIGNLLTGSPFGWFIGLALIGFGILVGAFVKPVYREEARPSVAPSVDRTAIPEVAPPAAELRAARPSVEADIGKRVFAWVGITAVLIGLTLFIGYSFQHFGNAGKLAVGYGATLLLLLVGRRLRAHFRAYSLVLEGGGWAAAYFVTYATSFVPQFSVLHNPTLTLFLLLLVVVAMAAISIAERSPAFTAGAFLLGYFTAAIAGTYGNFTLWSILLLAAGILLISLRRGWFAFSVGGTLATYLAFAVWVFQLTDRAPRGDYLTGAFFLILYGFLFGIGHVLTRAQERKELELVRTGVALNVGLSFLAALYLFSLAHTPSSTVALVYAGILGFFYVLARLLPAAGHLKTTYLVLAIAAFTAYFPFKYTDGATLSVAWIIEAAILVSAGVLGRTRVLRGLGYAVSLLASLLVLRELATLGDSGSTDSATSLTVVLLGAAIWYWLSATLFHFGKHLLGEDRTLGRAFGDVATAFLVLLTQVKVQHNLISVITGLEGLAVLTFGFALRVRHARLLAIAILSFTVLRVFIIDVAGLDAFGKMISFLVLGGLLLFVAYLYNRSRSFHNDEHASPESPTQPH